MTDEHVPPSDEVRSTFVVPGCHTNPNQPLCPWNEDHPHHEHYYCEVGGMGVAYNKFIRRVGDSRNLQRDGCLVVVSGPRKSGRTSLINRCACRVKASLPGARMSGWVIDLTTTCRKGLTVDDRMSRVSVGLVNKLLPLKLESWIRDRITSKDEKVEVTFPMLENIHQRSFSGEKIFIILLPPLEMETADDEIERYLSVMPPGTILMLEADPGSTALADHALAPLRMELDYLADGEAYGLVRQWSDAHAKAVQHAATDEAVAAMFAESRARLAESRAVKKDDLDKLQRYFRSRNGNIASGQLLAVLRTACNSSVIDDTGRSGRLDYVQYSEILEAWFGPTIGTDG